MNFFPISKEEKTSAQIVVKDVCRIKKNEKVLIIANPETNVIAQDLFTASLAEGAKPTLMYQTKKTSSQAADDAVIAAIKSEPDVCFSISALKLGKDEKAISSPYKDKDGNSYDSVFDYLLEGKKCMRAVWTPGLTEEMFERTVKIDYRLLAERCSKICRKLEGALYIHVKSPSGTDIKVPVKGRKALEDNGDFSKPGSGGNIPCGEVFISPLTGIKDKDGNGEGCQGLIVFDGSLTFSDGDAILKNPVKVKVEDGLVVEITGGEEAKRLLKDITNAEKQSLAMEAEGKLPSGQGKVYARNARNIGELGIGLNPAASISGNMLEDEKAFRTCHFAIGQNYDNDAPSLIHFDGLVRNPTITVTYEDLKEFVLLKDGELQL